ncbi:MAG: hypothetical protein WDO16_03415 [Bacteroidota bacterium]
MLVNRRFSILNQSIDRTRLGLEADAGVLATGNVNMQTIRLLVKKIQSIEEHLLTVRSERLKQFTTYTPVVIFVTGFTGCCHYYFLL